MCSGSAESAAAAGAMATVTCSGERRARCARCARSGLYWTVTAVPWRYATLGSSSSSSDAFAHSPVVLRMQRTMRPDVTAPRKAKANRV